MIDKITHIFFNISFFHVNMLFILGLALFGGTLGGRLFQKMKIPQVVGYIVIGICLGPTGVKMIDLDMLRVLQPFIYFSLGIIGFLIGGELKKKVFERHGKEFIWILLMEGLFSFALVTTVVGLIASYILKDAHFGWGLGLLFGSIASATAPAATTDVLWEYRTRGPLTTTIFGIVALDDALSLLLFSISASIATKIMGTSHESLLIALLHPLYEIGGAMIVGGLSGLILIKVLNKYHQKERALAFLIGAILFVLGLSLAINVSMLLAAMVLGTVVVNLAPQIFKNVFKLIEGITAPIFILFFVLIGAKINLAQMSTTVMIIILAYLVSRTIGKMSGAYLGATISKAPKSVQRYLPYCLFSQAGVAIGLSIVAAQLLPEQLGNIVIVTITSTTFLVQLIGPSCVKYAVTGAGEVGLNVTEEDILKQVKVADFIAETFPLIDETSSLESILKLFGDHPYFYYPVIDADKKLKGMISMDSIRQIFRFQDTDNLIIAADILEPINTYIADSSLAIEAKELFDKYLIDFIPVVDNNEQVIGGLEKRMFSRFIAKKQLEIEQKAL